MVEFQQVIWEDEMKGHAGVEGERELPLSPMRPPTTIATSPTNGQFGQNELDDRGNQQKVSK